MQCYATIVTTETYFAGVKLLRDSLKRTLTSYALKIFVPERLYNKLISTGDFTIQEIEKYNFDFKLNSYLVKLNDRSENSQWNYTFDKLVLFSKTEYEKIVYLDCDIEVKKNIDDLFNRPHMSAVKPSLGNPDYTRGFNSGVMVIVPKEGLDVKILELVNDPRLHDLSSISDNDLLQAFYHDWGKNPNQVLPDEYNVFYPYVNEYVNLKEIKIMHYIGKSKPWLIK